MTVATLLLSPSKSPTLPPGELHGGSDPCHHGQKVQHQKHVRDRTRGSWEVHADRLAGIQSGDHCIVPCRRNPLHRHTQRRAGALHHHQIYVCALCL